MIISNYLDSITNLYYPPEELQKGSTCIDVEEDDFEDVTYADAGVTQRQSQESVSKKAPPMQQRQTEVVWPIIAQPERDITEIALTPYSANANLPYSAKADIPLAVISVSSVFLEAAAHLRDLVLSYDDPSVGVSFVKLAAVGTITVTATALFEASNITEIAIRAMIFSCTYGFTAVLLLSGVLKFDIKENCGETVNACLTVGSMVNMASLAGVIHGVCIDILTPWVFAYHMICNTEPNMPHISVITNQATLTLQNTVVYYI